MSSFLEKVELGKLVRPFSCFVPSSAYSAPHSHLSFSIFLTLTFVMFSSCSSLDPLGSRCLLCVLNNSICWFVTSIVHTLNNSSCAPQLCATLMCYTDSIPMINTLWSLSFDTISFYISITGILFVSYM